jgi:hypothetical protein
VDARALTLGVLRRLPTAWMRQLAADGSGVAPTDHVDLIIVPGDIRGPSWLRGRASRGVATLTPGVPPALLAIPSLPAHVRASRLALLRLLDWLPGDDARAVLTDASERCIAAMKDALARHPDLVAVVHGETPPTRPAGDALTSRWRFLAPAAGVDELVVAMSSSAAYLGDSSSLGDVARGGGIPVASSSDELMDALAGTTPMPDPRVEDLEKAMDEAAARALVELETRVGDGPGRRAVASRLALERCLLEIEMGRKESELTRLGDELARTRDDLDRVTGSRSWRYTAHLRNAARAARERLQQ